MIIDHRHFTLAGCHTFERFRARGPYRARVAMPDEACFYYLIAGRARTYGPRDRVTHPSEEGIASDR